MIRSLCSRVAAAAVIGACLTGVTGIDEASAQVRRQRPVPPAAGTPGEAGADPAELGRLFDAYTVMQAQEALGLDDAQFGPFVTRLRALQQLRRRHLRERAVALRELRRILQKSPPDEAALQAQTDAVAALENTSRTDELAARRLIDEVLDVRQRARFLLLEQQLELRKLELVNRARARQRATRP